MRHLLLLLACLSTASAADIVLRGATVYPAPDAAPIADTVLVIRDGRIAAMGPAARTTPPAGAEIVDCTGKFVVAGFWNAHVHLITPVLLRARDASADELSAELERLFLRWGFTHVFDIASGFATTRTIRERIARGEVRGPQVLTVGEPLWREPPIYIRDFLAENRIDMPSVRSAEEMVQRVAALAAAGVDGIKLFTGSVQGRGAVANLPVEWVRAACDEAGRRGLPVFSHAQDTAGLEAAIDGGVDILAHPTPQSGPWTPELVARMRRANMALTPTLALFEIEGRRSIQPAAAFGPWMERITAQVRAFAAAGGDVIFGTDLGYIERDDPTLEFTLMGQAGMRFPQILAALTTTPARRFGQAARTGRLAPGMNADLVVIEADPAQDIAALAKVHLTMRGGRIVYRAR